jgi:transcriptional regulator with XRE-family HTH domain
MAEHCDIGVKLARRAKGWTQERLAQEATLVARRVTGDPTAKVSYSAVGMIESGARNPSLEVVRFLAVALGCEPSDLGHVKVPTGVAS